MKSNSPLSCYALLLALGLTHPALATDYYVSATGSDANAGTPLGSAWRNASKANTFTFKPGDRLLFEGGKTFAGPVRLTATDGGVVSNPVEVGSYGSGRAIIDGGAGSGLSIVGVTGIKVGNLNFVGLGRKTGNKGGTGVSLSGTVGAVVDQVDASGFQRAGIDVYNSTDVRLTNIYAYDNGYAGITAYGLTNAYVGYCRAISNPGDPTITNNHSGNGIVVSGKKITIEYCEAADNGFDMQQVNSNGPVGIWCFDADQVIIQYCIAHNNKSPKADGGGFDLDGGVTNSVVQYNYAYENKNYGYLAWEYGSTTKWTGNTFRYNISVNNSGPGLLLGTSGGQGVSNCQVYHNLFYNTAYPAVGQYGGASNFSFRNNIFVGPSSASLVATVSGLTYQANDYWFTNGGFNVGGYGSLAAWANATGQEKVNGALVGLNADPKLFNPANYERLTDPTKLPTLTAFLLQAGSPVVDKGLNLQTAFGIDPGTRDFYGNAIPAGSGVDMGAQEVTGTTTPLPPTTSSNLATNPSFEADAAAMQAPVRWNTWAGSAGTDADADYTETNGGARTGTYHGTHYKTSNYEVYTSQVAAGLTNGLYTLRAWVKSSGGQTHALLLAKNYGGAQLSVTPATTSGGISGAWQQVEVRNINVTNGQCEFGFYSYATGGKWLFFDDVELIKQAPRAARLTTSTSARAQLGASANFESWPNPVQDKLTVSYPSPLLQPLELRVFSQTGQLVLHQQQALVPGANVFSLSTSTLSPGLYLLQTSAGERVQHQRLHVARP
ncbi:right-handed parallel beta-helix repeat-containing protein [Hymenobacter terrenus]|uniref:right-handed parallel beta-helix repeat-containing protein n=1 Tax=Hymenobacter terrenus TaxID=1629124 RepID=UPI0006982A7F|nr:right-handed parallel beta-helix repeat-containing protein [Hymenobacter terrenus]